MKLTAHPDLTSIRQTKRVEVAPGVELEIQDLPPTYGDELEAALPEPKPPSKGPLYDRNKRIERDQAGRPLLEYDWHDAEYLKALAEHRTLALVFFVTEGVVDGQLEFEVELNGSPREYYRAVLDEMKAFGFGIGQVTRIADAVRELSGISDADVEEAAADFS